MKIHMTPLDKFGQFIVANLRDRALEQHQMLQAGECRGPARKDLQDRLRALPTTERELVSEVVRDVVNVATHDLLFAFQDAHDRRLGIEVTVDGLNVAEDGGMLQGEPLGETGWVNKFSRYPNG